MVDLYPTRVLNFWSMDLFSAARWRCSKCSAVTFRALVRVKYKPQTKTFGSTVRPPAKRRAGRESWERERGARPCGLTVRGCATRASLRRILKDVAYCLKFVVSILLAQRGEAVGSYIGWRGVALEN
jgi:hypothetical protein